MIYKAQRLTGSILGEATRLVSPSGEVVIIPDWPRSFIESMVRYFGGTIEWETDHVMR